jgi:hypothetical protein
MEDGSEAPRRGGGSVKRRADRPTGGARRPGAKPVRVQLHLGAITAQRLGVHAAMSQQDKSKVADAILTAWLGRFGKGRELFAPVESEALVSEAEAPTE